MSGTSRARSDLSVRARVAKRRAESSWNTRKPFLERLIYTFIRTYNRCVFTDRLPHHVESRSLEPFEV